MYFMCSIPCVQTSCLQNDLWCNLHCSTYTKRRSLSQIWVEVDSYRWTRWTRWIRCGGGRMDRTGTRIHPLRALSSSGNKNGGIRIASICLAPYPLLPAKQVKEEQGTSMNISFPFSVAVEISGYFSWDPPRRVNPSSKRKPCLLLPLLPLLGLGFLHLPHLLGLIHSPTKTTEKPQSGDTERGTSTKQLFASTFLGCC